MPQPSGVATAAEALVALPAGAVDAATLQRARPARGGAVGSCAGSDSGHTQRAVPVAPQKLEGNCGHYIKAISLKDILNGVNHNNEIYQARRTLKGLQRRGEDSSTSAVLLDAHLSMAEKAKQCVPEELPRLSKETRVQYLEGLAAEGLEFPWAVQVVLVAVAAKETDVRVQ